MRKFRSAYDSYIDDISTPSGSSYRDEFVLSVDEEGRDIVKPNGVTNIQQYINSFKSQTDIYQILDRLSSSNESIETVVNILQEYRQGMFVRNGVYGDMTQLPKNLHDLQKTYTLASDLFFRLPEDFRAKYHNNANEFFADSKNLVKLFDQKPKVPKDTKSTTNESEAVENA